jgi:L-2,4-diaminobutyric acid acetyltransferase
LKVSKHHQRAAHGRDHDPTPTTGVHVRPASPEDGAAIWELVRASQVLDLNSAYLYLLLCRDFQDTCVVAEQSDRVLGFVSGYRPPSAPGVIFLWQIGVLASARGLGLGKQLVHAFLQAPGSRGAHSLETTVSPSNQASLALFASVARDLGASLTRLPGFAGSDFPPTDGGRHEAEDRYRIAPLPLNRAAHSNGGASAADGAHAAIPTQPTTRTRS